LKVFKGFYGFGVQRKRDTKFEAQEEYFIYHSPYHVVFVGQWRKVREQKSRLKCEIKL